MKILSKEEKKLKKEEFKSDIFFISDYMLNIDLKKYEKRANKYIYHYNRLLNKRAFLYNRMMNLDLYTRLILSTKKEYFTALDEAFDYTQTEAIFQKIFELIGVVSYDKVIPEIDRFERSVLEFSKLIAIASNILDNVDPKNKDKFKYNKVKDFTFKITRALTPLKTLVKNKIR